MFILVEVRHIPPIFSTSFFFHRFLQQSLVVSAPTIDARVQKARSASSGSAKHRGGSAGATSSSGRLHRNDAGDWVWSSDDENKDNSEDDDDETDNSKSSSSNSKAKSGAAGGGGTSVEAISQRTINMVGGVAKKSISFKHMRHLYNETFLFPRFYACATPGGS